MDNELPPPEITAEEKRAMKKAEKLAKKAARKAAKAEELRLKSLQLRRDMLKREEGYVKTTYERAATDWTKMMTEIRQNELREELQMLWDSVQMEIDTRDNHIDRLLEDKQHAEQQFRKCSEEHLRFLDLSKSIFHYSNLYGSSI